MNRAQIEKRIERQKLIEHMLSELEIYFESEGNQVHSFIESLREQFDDRLDLSDKQMEALRRFYENID